MGIELLIVSSPEVSDPLARLRQCFPTLWSQGGRWFYRSLDFSAALVEKDHGVLVVGQGRLDSGFWSFVRAARVALAGEVRDVATGRVLNLDEFTPPLAYLPPGTFLRPRLRQS
jgi:hypothetical protein